MKYLWFGLYQMVFIIFSTLLIWECNKLGLWGDSFIVRYGWTYWDILILVACINVSHISAKIDDFST